MGSDSGSVVPLMFMLRAVVRHWFGKHTPVQALRDPESRWCYICGEKL